MAGAGGVAAGGVAAAAGPAGAAGAGCGAGLAGVVGTAGTACGCGGWAATGRLSVASAIAMKASCRPANLIQRTPSVAVPAVRTSAMIFRPLTAASRTALAAYPSNVRRQRNNSLTCFLDR